MSTAIKLLTIWVMGLFLLVARHGAVPQDLRNILGLGRDPPLNASTANRLRIAQDEAGSWIAS